MIGAAAFCVFRAIQDSPGTLIFVQIVISLISTCEEIPDSFHFTGRVCADDLILIDGSYVIASILALDPWHLGTSACFSGEAELTSFSGGTVTSMLQYMLFAPVYINLLKYVPGFGPPVSFADKCFLTASLPSATVCLHPSRHFSPPDEADSCVLLDFSSQCMTSRTFLPF